MKKMLILATVLAAGCSSMPTEPDPAQEWLTLDQYKARPADHPYRWNPVVTVPEGTEVELRMSRKGTRLIGDGFDRIFFDMLEPAEEKMISVKLKARRTVHLDLEHFLASTDKQSWMALSFVFFPIGRATQVTVGNAGAAPAIVVPVWADMENPTLRRDLLSDSSFR